MVNASLQNTATVAVGRDLDTISSNSIVDELLKRTEVIILVQVKRNAHIPGYPQARACSSTSE